MGGVENPIATDEEQPDDAVVPTTSDDAGSALLVEAVDRATDRVSSWHQATIQYFMDASLRGAANKMYAVAFVIVLGQYLVSISIVVSTFNPDVCDSCAAVANLQRRASVDLKADRPRLMAPSRHSCTARDRSESSPDCWAGG